MYKRLCRINPTYIFLCIIFIGSIAFAMDPIRVSLLMLPKQALVKIIVDKGLKNKQRARLMQTCKDLCVFVSPDNLLKETIPLGLYRNIQWPVSVLEVAVLNKSFDCCNCILNNQYNKIEKKKKTIIYKLSRDKSLIHRNAHFLYQRSLFFPISLECRYMFDENWFITKTVKIPLIAEKKSIQSLFNKLEKPLLAQYYAQDNLEKMKWHSQLESIDYPINLLGHACFFGKVDMLQNLLATCKGVSDIYRYCKDPSEGLAIATEYDNPECFKTLYNTIWLKDYFETNDKLSEIKCNYLEAFVLYVHNKKIIETLLKTGCFTINDYVHVRKGVYDKPVIKKSFKGKTLLDIVLEEKDKCTKCSEYTNHTFNAFSALHVDSTYYQEIAELLRKYGGKTALEIAGKCPFNEYFPEDIQKKFIYEHNFLVQQKFRLVCKQWKKIVDSHWLGFYFALLRNKRPQHTIFRNTIRVLLSAVYNSEYTVVKTILKVFKQNNFRRTYYSSDLPSSFNNMYYNFSDFVPNKAIQNILKRYTGFTFYIKKTDTLDALIIASFLNDVERLKEIMSFLEKILWKHDNSLECVDKTDKWAECAEERLKHSCLILADYDYSEGISVLINTLKQRHSFHIFLNDLIMVAYYYKSLRVLEALLSAEIDINYIHGEYLTIKDKIIHSNTKEIDKEYVSKVNFLLDKYNAKTYIEQYLEFIAQEKELCSNHSFNFFDYLFKHYRR